MWLNHDDLRKFVETSCQVTIAESRLRASACSKRFSSQIFVEGSSTGGTAWAKDSFLQVEGAIRVKNCYVCEIMPAIGITTIG